MPPVVDSLLEAIRHQRDGEPARAEAIYRDVIAREPEQPNALYLYGMLALQDGREGAAAALLERAARVRPDADTRLHLARARLALGEAEGALDAANEALAAGGPTAEVLYVQGTALNACGRPAEALVALEAALARNPRHAAARLNLGNALSDLDRLEEAVAAIEAALHLDPGLVEAHASLGYVLACQGHLQPAIAACERAVALDGGNGQAHWNLATALLLAGDLDRGFREYEWRKRHAAFSRHFETRAGLAWTGQDLEGRTLLVHAEQGLGDTIQLARYMPLLAARGARVVLACSRGLVPLLRGQPGLADVVPRNGPAPPHDLWVDQMSLPRLLGTTLATVPGAGGYLAAEPGRRRAWAARHEQARIGLVWAGNPLHSNDSRRSMPREAAAALVQPGMLSLQVGKRAGEAEALGLVLPDGVLQDYADTAALVANLELVITVDTSVAHLAGALGVPVWIMLPHAPDWRWMTGRTDSPWYRTARLFRQDSPGDWSSVTRSVTAALAERG